MAYMNWDDSFKVNVKTIDTQHVRLVELINNLHEAMKLGKGKDIMAGVLNELADYTVTHFSNEQNLMTQYNYPQYPGHKVEHDKFVNQVKSFQSDFNSGKIAITLEVMNFLKNWLVNHILGTDKKVGAFLNEKGIA